jgi:O-antigen/teichoic acid export membrane protein
MTRILDEKLSWRWVRTYAGSFGSLILGTVGQIASVLILARYLGAYQFGQLMTVVAVGQVGLNLCGIGAGEAMVRRVARDPALYPRLLGHNLILVLGSGLIITLVLVAIIPFLFPDIWTQPHALLTLLLLVASQVLGVRWIMMVDQIFLARGRYGMANLINAGNSLLRAAAAVAAFLLFGVTALWEWAIWLFGAAILSVLVTLLLIRPFGRPVWQVIRAELPLGLSYSTPAFFLALRQNADLVSLGAFASPAIVGAYAFARRANDQAVVAIDALMRIVYPRLAIVGAEGATRVIPLTVRYTFMALAVALATGLAVFLLAPLLPWILGEDFAPSVILLQVLCWIILVKAVQAVAYDSLGAIEHHRPRARLYNVGSLIAVGVIAALTWGFGWVGTIVGVYAAEIGITAALWVMLLAVRRREAQRAGAGAAADEGGAA